MSNVKIINLSNVDVYINPFGKLDVIKIPKNNIDDEYTRNETKILFENQQSCKDFVVTFNSKVVFKCTELFETPITINYMCRNFGITQEAVDESIKQIVKHGSGNLYIMGNYNVVSQLGKFNEYIDETYRGIPIIENNNEKVPPYVLFIILETQDISHIGAIIDSEYINWRINNE